MPNLQSENFGQSEASFESHMTRNFTACLHSKFCQQDSQLSPVIILMSGGAHEGGILQRELFNRESESGFGPIAEFGFWEK